MTLRPTSKTSSEMPSLFPSSASLRSRSVSETPGDAATGTYGRRGSATLDALTRGLKKKSGVEVVLDGKDEFIRTYSTYDKIQGHVALCFDKDTLIADMIICFEGISLTYIERLAAASPTVGRTTGKHTFLRILQPISQESLPEHNFAKANQTYKIPFTFVVPDRLLPYICSHKVEHEEVRRAHLSLPPSIGDPMLAGEGNVLMDDLAPDMAKIGYSIRVRVGKASPSTGKLTDIDEKVCRVRIVPAQEEQPPMTIADDNNSYVLRKEKNVRKGVFKIGKKLGRLTAEVAQPKSLRQKAPSSQSREPVTTMASVKLRFDPASEQEQPPQMANCSAKLKVYTFFGAAAYKTLPEVSKLDTWSTVHGMYPESVSLSSRNIGSVIWTKHDPESRQRSVASGTSTLSRRESNYSTDSSNSASSDSIPAASSGYDASLPYYTAKVLVPLSLPQHSESEEEPRSPTSPTLRKASLSLNNKKIIYIPTFHSCIISRIYALELGLSFKAVNSQGNTTSSVGASSLTLRTPIQVSQESSSPPPIEDADSAGMLDMSLIEGTDEYDEAMARHLDHELNFTNPFRPSGRPEAIPEYEEIQTNSTVHPGAARHASIAGIPSVPMTTPTREQPPEYYSPFRSSTTGSVPAAGSGLGRRVSIRLRS